MAVARNPSSPVQNLSQTTSNTQNLNPSPFPGIQSFMGGGTQRGQNPQSPVSGQNPPNFGNSGGNLAQSISQLTSAITRLSQVVGGGGGGSSGAGAPVFNRSARQAGPAIDAPFSAIGNHVYKAGMGLGGLIGAYSAYTGQGPATPMTTAELLTRGAGNTMRGFIGAGASMAGKAIGYGLQGANMVGGASASLMGASSASGLFQSFNSIPFVGGMLASLGSSFGVAQNRFGEMSNYEKVATMTSLQLNKGGREKLTLHAPGIESGGMNAAANEFRQLGIGPTEGASLLGQMLSSTGALDGSGHMTVAGLTLPNMMRQGYSAGTVGFSQRLKSDIFKNKFVGPDADLQIGSFRMGRGAGFNDQMQAQFMQDIYSMQTGRALSGATSGMSVSNLRGGIGAFQSLGFGENAMAGLTQRENKMGSLGQISSPYSGLAENMLRFGFLKKAGFDPEQAARLQENATGIEKFAMIAQTEGVDRAKRYFRGAGLNTNEIDSLAAQYQGAQAEMSPFEKFTREKFTGNKVARTAAELESGRVQKFRDTVDETARLNNKIEEKQMEFLQKNFKDLSNAALNLADAQSALLEVTVKAIKELNEIVEEVRKGKSIGKVLYDKYINPFAPTRDEQAEKERKINNLKKQSPSTVNPMNNPDLPGYNPGAK